MNAHLLAGALAVARAYLGETPGPWECPRCHCLFERAGLDHEPCRTEPAESAIRDQLGETNE